MWVRGARRSRPRAKDGNGYVDADELSGSLATALTILSGNTPGYRFVRGTDVPGALEQFRTLPPQGRLRLLAPHGGREFRGALHCFSIADKWRDAAATVAGASGVGHWLAGHLSLVGPSTDGVSPLRNFLGDIVGTTDFSLAIRLTSGRPNAKIVIAAISPDGDPICFLKFGPQPLVSRLVRAEAATLAELADAPFPATLPTVLFSGSWSECDVLVTTSVPMRSLPTNSDLPHGISDQIFEACPSRRDTLAASSFWSAMTTRIHHLADDGHDPDGTLQRSHAMVEHRWHKREFEFGRGHGDWAKSNLGLNGSRLVAIDWERSRPDLPRNMDLAHFALAGGRQTVRSRLLDHHAVEARTARHLAAAGRPHEAAEALVVLDLLEMVVRFAEASSAGLPGHDTKFGPMLAALHVEGGGRAGIRP